MGLDEAGVSPEAQAVLKSLAAQVLELTALLQKPDVTLAELRTLLSK